MHRRPDAAPGRPSAAGPLVDVTGSDLVDDLAEAAHVLDRDDDLDVELLACPGIDDRDGTRPTLLIAAEEPSDLLQRSLRCRQPDALR